MYSPVILLVASFIVLMSRWLQDRWCQAFKARVRYAAKPSKPSQSTAGFQLSLTADDAWKEVEIVRKTTVFELESKDRLFSIHSAEIVAPNSARI